MAARRTRRPRHSPPGISHHASSRRDFLRASATAACSLAVLAERGAAPRPPWSAAGGLEKRRLGKTDMTVTVLGFGAAEIGYEKTDQDTVGKLLNAALD